MLLCPVGGGTQRFTEKGRRGSQRGGVSRHNGFVDPCRGQVEHRGSQGKEGEVHREGASRHNGFVDPCRGQVEHRGSQRKEGEALRCMGGVSSRVVSDF